MCIVCVVITYVVMQTPSLSLSLFPHPPLPPSLTYTHTHTHKHRKQHDYHHKGAWSSGHLQCFGAPQSVQ